MNCKASVLPSTQKDQNFRNPWYTVLRSRRELVDRIVTGYPKKEASAICEELGYEDQLIDAGEVFAFWAIEGPQSIKEEFPFEKADLPILVTDNHKPYKQRKVRILNGAHTSFVPGAYLAGQNIVRDCMNDEVIRGFMNQTIYEEIIPTLDLPKEELLGFASAVTERFNNPFIDHSLLAITLNCTSKWRGRLLPSLKEYIRRKGTLPKYFRHPLRPPRIHRHDGRSRGWPGGGNHHQGHEQAGARLSQSRSDHGDFENQGRAPDCH